MGVPHVAPDALTRPDFDIRACRNCRSLKALLDLLVCIVTHCCRDYSIESSYHRARSTCLTQMLYGLIEAEPPRSWIA